MNTLAKTTHLSFLQQIVGERGNSIVYYALAAIAGSLLLWVSAKVQVPFWPVPMTMQPFAVVMIGMLCGLRLGVATVGLYLMQGAAGLPVFAGGGGVAYMMGPTAGFLLGFLLAAAVCGWLAERGLDRHVVSAFAVALVGMAVIYGCGLLWLGGLIGIGEAVAVGFYPFVLGDVVKALLVALCVPAMWKFVKKS